MEAHLLLFWLLFPLSFLFTACLSLSRCASRGTAGAKTVTEDHLKATATPEDRLKEMVKTALLGDQDLTEPGGAEERLLGLRGLGESERKKTRALSKEEHSPSSPQFKGRKPGDRSPGRDRTGSGAEQLHQDEDGR